MYFHSYFSIEDMPGHLKLFRKIEIPSTSKIQDYCSFNERWRDRYANIFLRNDCTFRFAGILFDAFNFICFGLENWARYAIQYSNGKHVHRETLNFDLCIKKIQVDKKFQEFIKLPKSVKNNVCVTEITVQWDYICSSWNFLYLNIEKWRED